MLYWAHSTTDGYREQWSRRALESDGLRVLKNESSCSYASYSSPVHRPSQSAGYLAHHSRKCVWQTGHPRRTRVSARVSVRTPPRSNAKRMRLRCPRQTYPRILVPVLIFDSLYFILEISHGPVPLKGWAFLFAVPTGSMQGILK